MKENTNTRKCCDNCSNMKRTPKKAYCKTYEVEIRKECTSIDIKWCKKFSLKNATK